MVKKHSKKSKIISVYHKKKIPKKVKEEVWYMNFGKIYENKCYISWCSNKINVFNFHVGHDVPESKGGTDEISNLKPICDRCNLSMGHNYTIKEWNIKFDKNNKTKLGMNNNIYYNFYKCIGGCIFIYMYMYLNNYETINETNLNNNSKITENKNILNYFIENLNYYYYYLSYD